MVSSQKENDGVKIVIDARMINASGIGRYLQNLISELQRLDTENEYFILLLKEDYGNNKFLDSRLRENDTGNFNKILADFRWYTVNEQIKLPGIINKIKPDLVHFPHFNVPIWYRGKYVVTIHDLIHQHFPTRLATTKDPITFKAKQVGYNFVFKKAVTGSRKIFTPSQFVKDQLVSEWAVDESKIIVTPEGVDNKLTTAVGTLLPEKVKKPYIFYVGNAFPHKNITGLIKAFLKIKEKNNGLQLVLSGQSSQFWERIKKDLDSRLRGNDIVLNDIIFTGFVTDQELVALYKNAQCFVMPSFEEGFGIPILEAMAMGVPVVSSNAGSLEEVGGDAALYFDPGDLEDMVDKIDRVLKEEKLRIKLISKGKARVKQFSWKKMAMETLEVYNSVI